MPSNAEELVDDVLMHYSSQFYDPVKAHEYYLKTRQLLGKPTTQGMSSTQKEAWAYSKNQIGTDKKTEHVSAQDTHKLALQKLQADAKATHDRIQAQIKAFAENLAIQRMNTTDPKLRAYLAKNQQGLVKDNAAKQSAQLKQVTANLHNAIAKARTSYTEAVKQLDAKYKAATAKEYDNIRTQLPGQAPKSKAVPKAHKPKAPAKHPAAKRPRKALQNGSNGQTGL